MIRKTISFFALLLLRSVLSYGAAMDSVVCSMTDVDGRYREHNCDFSHISLDVRFEPKEGKVMGKETLEFSAIQPDIDSVYLDAPGIKIQKLELDNGKSKVSYESTKEGLIIRFANKLHWEEKHSMYIEYEAYPRKGLYFIGWNDEKNISRKQIWTQGQGIDNRNWFPCYDDVDDKVITETTITFDAAYTVVSNGTLVDSRLNSDGTKTWHYAMTKPMAPYLVMLAIEKYAWKDYKSKNGIVSREYYYADQPQVEAPTYQYSAEMMDWLEAEIGVPYQWPSYSNSPVQDFMFGAMENTTATIYGDFYMQDRRAGIDRSYAGVNAHELTHQWFGDYITEYSGTHHWLHESFATYYSKMFLRHALGEDQYQWAKRGEELSAIRVDRENRYVIAHTKAGTPRHYPKGSFVIGMLRYVVGDEIYKKTVSTYLLKHGFDNVDTHDFYRSFQDVCGVNLDWFFDEWIYHSGVPAYYVSYEAASDKTTFHVSQTHSTDSLTHLFQMPIVFEVHYTDHSRDTMRLMVSQKENTIIVPNKAGKQIAYTLFDPGANVLKTVTAVKSYKEWIAQATSAVNMIDRYDAVHALRDSDIEHKRADLLAIFNSEKYYIIRSEIVYQLKSDLENKQTIVTLRKALKDPHFGVRRSVIDFIDTLPKSLLADAELLLNDSSYVTIESTLKKLAAQYPKNRNKYFETVKNTLGLFKNVRITLLELKCQQQPDETSIEELVGYTSHSYEFMTRVNAMAAIERLKYGSEPLMKNLIDAMLNPNYRLANPARKTFKKLMDIAVFKGMATKYYQSTDWKDWQRDILKGLFE